MHFISTASEFGNKIPGKETGITSGYIYVYIFHANQTVENRLKLSQQLYLIKQYIIHSIIFNLLFEIWIQHIRNRFTAKILNSLTYQNPETGANRSKFTF